MGFYLSIKSTKKKIYNIAIFGFGFIAMSLVFPLGLLEHGYFIRELIVQIAFILFVVFTNQTFYRNRGFIPKLVLVIVIVSAVNQLVFQLMVDYFFPDNVVIYYLKIVLDIPHNLLVFNWMGFASYSAYKRIETADVEPWIKVRYRMIAIFSFIGSLHFIPELLQPIEYPMGSPASLASVLNFGLLAIITIIYSSGYALAWFMPNRLKRYLNRNYQPVEEETFSEEELMNLIRNQLQGKER